MHVGKLGVILDRTACKLGYVCRLAVNGDLAAGKLFGVKQIANKTLQPLSVPQRHARQALEFLRQVIDCLGDNERQGP